jgi:hypothetical protein
MVQTGRLCSEQVLNINLYLGTCHPDVSPTVFGYLLSGYSVCPTVFGYLLSGHSVCPTEYVFAGVYSN